jgi:hypothetical protein
MSEDPKGVFAVWRRLIKPIGSTLFSIAVAQSLIAMWITYCEAKSYYEIQAKLNMESYEAKELSHTF